MNRSMIRYVTSWILRIEGLLLCSSIVIGLIYREFAVLPAYLIVIAGCEGIGFLLSKQPGDNRIY